MIREEYGKEPSGSIRDREFIKQAKGLIFGPSAKRTEDLLKLNRDQL
jgi:hypothetical protein